jgi:hypothetical protein
MEERNLTVVVHGEVKCENRRRVLHVGGRVTGGVATNPVT